MNRESFKMARDTLRTAVRDYGFKRTEYQCTGTGQMRTEYRYGPGKFEGEHWSIVHWYEAMLNGMGDEPLTEGEDTVADLFEVSDTERAAFGINPGFDFAVLWYSVNGFCTLEYVSADGYDKLREQYEGAES